MTAEYDPFESPKLLIEGAQENIADFQARSDAFFGGNPTARVEEIDRSTGEKLIKLRITAALPGRLRVKASDALNNLRHALDQAVCASSVALRGKAATQAYFPFGRSPDDVADILKSSRYSHVPAELHALLVGFEPYPPGADHAGGDELLREFGRISGPNKHQSLLKVGADLNSIHIGALRLSGQVSIPNPVFDSSKNELIFARLGPTGRIDYDIGLPFFVAFNAPGPLNGKPVATYLRLLAGKVEGIVLAVEAETARILGERAA